MKRAETFIQIGEFHKRNSNECQDVVYYRENDEFSMIALADGASFGENGKTGARLSCETAMDFYMEEGEILDCFPEEKAAALIWEQIRYRLEEESLIRNNPLNSYASTLAFVFYNKRKKKVTAFNLGDGGIFWTDSKSCHSMMMPVKDRHCRNAYTNQKQKYGAVKLSRRNVEGMDSVFICSDGVLNEMQNWSLEEGLKRDMVEKNYIRASRRLKRVKPEDDCSYVAMRF